MSLSGAEFVAAIAGRRGPPRWRAGWSRPAAAALSAAAAASDRVFEAVVVGE
jgi:hypothetical protein